MLQSTGTVFIPTWSISLISTLLTALGLRWQHFAVKTHGEVPHSAGALGVRKEQVSGHFPLSLVMANPWNSALPLLFVLLVLMDMSRSIFSCTAKIPLCPACPLPLFELSQVCPLCESFLTHSHIEGMPGPHTPGDKHQWLCVCLCDPQPWLEFQGFRPFGNHLTLCFLLWPPEEMVMCSKTWEQLGFFSLKTYSSFSPAIWAGE